MLCVKLAFDGWWCQPSSISWVNSQWNQALTHPPQWCLVVSYRASTELQLPYTQDTQLCSKIIVQALKLILYQTEKHHWYSNYPSDTALKVGVYTYVYTVTHVRIHNGLVKHTFLAITTHAWLPTTHAYTVCVAYGDYCHVLNVDRQTHHQLQRPSPKGISDVKRSQDTCWILFHVYAKLT